MKKLVRLRRSSNPYEEPIVWPGIPGQVCFTRSLSNSHEVVLLVSAGRLHKSRSGFQWRAWERKEKLERKIDNRSNVKGKLKLKGKGKVWKLQFSRLFQFSCPAFRQIFSFFQENLTPSKRLHLLLQLHLESHSYRPGSWTDTSHFSFFFGILFLPPYHSPDLNSTRIWDCLHLSGWRRVVDRPGTGEAWAGRKGECGDSCQGDKERRVGRSLPSDWWRGGRGPPCWGGIAGGEELVSSRYDHHP